MYRLQDNYIIFLFPRFCFVDYIRRAVSSFLLLFKLQFIFTFFFPFRYCLRSSSRFPPSHRFFFSVSNTDTSFLFATLKLCKEEYDGYLRACSLQPHSCFPLSSLLYFFLFASSSFVLLCLW